MRGLMRTPEEEIQNAVALNENGYPLYCPHCNMTVNLFLVDYRRHLLSNKSCLYCKKEWPLENMNSNLSEG